jgi:hypothetical protein
VLCCWIVAVLTQGCLVGICVPPAVTLANLLSAQRVPFACHMIMATNIDYLPKQLYLIGNVMAPHLICRG